MNNKPPIIIKKISKSKQRFYRLVRELKHLGIQITEEYKFCQNRKFRSDFMLEYKRKKILVEYEGIFSTKSRHSGVIGYTNDCEKYNIATLLGFPVLRYTAKNYKEVTTNVLEIFGIEQKRSQIKGRNICDQLTN
jgi:hypothetical protein